MRRLAARDRLPDGAFDLLAVIDEVRARLANLAPLGDTIQRIVEATGYRDHLEREHPDDAIHRAARLETLAHLASRYDDVRRFLDDAALATTVDTPTSPGGRVRISTIHAAKGTEYDHVYVAGCEDGVLPIAIREQARALPESSVADGTPETAHSIRVRPRGTTHLLCRRHSCASHSHDELRIVSSQPKGATLTVS